MDLNDRQRIELLANLVRARRFGQLFAGPITRGRLLGVYHQAEGGEAPGAGATTFLWEDDFLWPGLRGHGLPQLIGKGVDPTLFLAEHCGTAPRAPWARSLRCRWTVAWPPNGTGGAR